MPAASTQEHEAMDSQFKKGLATRKQVMGEAFRTAADVVDGPQKT